MLLSYWRPALLIVAVVGFVAGAIGVQLYTIERLIHDDATVTARAWTQFLGQYTKDVGRIAAGEPPSPETKVFLERVKPVARVFLYKIYDPQGYPRFVSDDVAEPSADGQPLAEHNPEAAEAIASGKLIIEIKEGTPPGRPAFYSEAYIPIVGADGKVGAVVETYIDQTAKRAEFQSIFLLAAGARGFLVAMLLGIPAAIWYLRRRDHARSSARIHYLANFDALSGLANRASLTDRLTRALAATGGKGLAVHCVDIDRFKDINDQLGLNAGDLMIKIAGERLQAVAGPNDIVARLAGDEFAVVQRTPRDRADVEVFAHKLAQAMSAPVSLSGEEVALTVGVGVAIAPDHGKDAERLIKSAELALAKGKSEGRARVRFFSQELDSELTQRLKLERAIDNALATGGFTLDYQPLYSEPGETLVGFEALARLQGEDGAFIPPSAFIPTAERMGAINRLGTWVLQEACTAATHWPEHLTVSVNLSPAQFGRGSIGDIVATALATTGLKPGRLLLEITESLLLSDRDSVMAELARLKALGAEIVMDDFGTGYSSLSYLWRFPFDKIKIDGSFMRAFDTPGAPAAKIMRTIATLGHALGMRVCVEGVETERHAEYARSIGCDEVQGFHFGRPKPGADVAAAILADYRRGLENPPVQEGKAISA